MEPAALHQAPREQAGPGGGQESMRSRLRNTYWWLSLGSTILIIVWSLEFAVIGALIFHASWVLLNRSYLANSVATVIPTLCSSV